MKILLTIIVTLAFTAVQGQRLSKLINYTNKAGVLTTLKEAKYRFDHKTQATGLGICTATVYYYSAKAKMPEATVVTANDTLQSVSLIYNSYRQYLKMNNTLKKKGFVLTTTTAKEEGSNYTRSYLKSPQYPHITLINYNYVGGPVKISDILFKYTLVWDNEVKGVRF